MLITIRLVSNDDDDDDRPSHLLNTMVRNTSKITVNNY